MADSVYHAPPNFQNHNKLKISQENFRFSQTNNSAFNMIFLLEQLLRNLSCTKIAILNTWREGNANKYWDGWLDDLRFYVLFNSISVISGRWRMIMKGCVQWNPFYGGDFASSKDRTGIVRSVGQQLTH